MGTPAQVSQLVLQVDANVAVAQRSLQELARVVKQSSDGMNSSLESAVQSHTRLTASSNNARLAQMELAHVVRASVDDYAAGASPIRILTMEMARLAEAAELMGGGGGALGKVAKFMQGGWGIAILFGVSALAQLIGKLAEGGDSVSSLVEKMRKEAQQAQLNKQAAAVWAASIDGLIDRNEKLIDTLQKRLKAEEDIDLQQLQAARRGESTAEKTLLDAKTKLANLQAQQAAQDRANATGGAGARADSLASVGKSNVLSSQIAEAQQEVATAQKAVLLARTAIAESSITVGQDQGKALADLGAAADLWSKRYISAIHGIVEANHGALAGSTETITSGFYALEKAMKDAAGAKISTQFFNARTQAKNLGNELAAGKITAQQYADKMKSLASSLEAAAEAAKNAKKGTGEFGKQIGFAQAEQIAKAAGLTVTSGYRSVAEQARLFNDPHYNHPGNPVARPGASAHNGINGRWALDIAFGPGITAQSLKKLYGEQGVILSAVYKESGHYHIEGSTSRASAEQRAAERAAQKQKTDDDQFARESAQLDAELLAARKQLVAGYDTQADLQAGEVEAQRQTQRDAIQRQLDAHQITADQAQILGIQVDDRAAAQQAVIARQKLARLMDQQAQAADQAIGYQLEDLKFADDQASTQAEHRKLQLEILDIQYQQKEEELKRLQHLVTQNRDWGKSPALQQEYDRYQVQLDRLPTQKSQDQARIEKGTMDPLQAWADKVPHEAATITEAFQSIEVQGIDNLVSGIADVINGTKSVGSVFRDISRQVVGDVAQIIIKMLVLRAITGMFGGGGGGLGNVFGGGNTLAGAGGLNFSGISGFLASGGPVSAGKTYVVGEKGPELFVPSTSGTIVPNTPKISMGRGAANNNSPQRQEIIVHVATDENFHASVEQVAGQVVVAAAPHIVKAAAKTTITSVRRPTLSGTR